jgi:tetratricopeptide (TPR) repeat protein
MTRALWLCLCLARAAGAQVSLDPDTEIARRHFEAGRLQYEASDYEGALREFEAARKVRNLPAFDYNIARCLDRLERPAEAIAAYERYLAASGETPDVFEVRERVRVLKERIAPPSETATPPPIAKPPPHSSRRWIAPGVTTGVTLALAVTGAGLLGSVKIDYDRMLTGPSACRPCSDAQVSPLRVRADAGYVVLGVSGALAVVDVILWVRAARQRR